MNWEAIGAVGELIGALSVVLSLVYLAGQIRNQIEESRIAVTNSLTQQWGELMQAMAADENMYGIWRRGVEDFEALNEIERGRLSSLLANLTQIFESLHLHHLDGRVDDQIWNGFQTRLRDIFSMPGVRTWWSYRSHWHSERFREFVSQEMEAGKNLTLYTDVYTGKTPQQETD